MEPRSPHWHIHPRLSDEQVRRVQRELSHLGLTPLMVQLLANRGLLELEEIESFIQPQDVSQHPDPTMLTGMQPAVERICQALSSHEKVVVYGDYDADGVTSTALLTTALRHFGADVEPYVPNRASEGYGLNPNAVRELGSRGTRLLITVDCGISGREEVEVARQAGMDVIVTDHHHLPADLPNAAACINPKQFVAGCECYQELAGVGVAYQLVRALVKRCGKPKRLRNKDLLGLVAIGTVADVVQLKGANRPLVQQGLAAIPENSLPGLRTMLEYAGLKPGAIDTDRVGFIIGPRLNAAGRVDDARTAYELLMTEDAYYARQLAQKLEAQNRRRQAMMNAIVEQARERGKRMDDNTRVIVLHDSTWPSGVVGLVAGRLVEEFGRPAVVIEQVGDESRGSARSVPQFNMVEALAEASDLLVKYGGHSAAAGFTIKTENIEELNRRLCATCDKQLQNEQLRPTISADAELPVNKVDDETLAQINRMSPFGAGNPSPMFVAKGVRVVSASTVGDNDAHLKLIVADRNNGHTPLEAIAFRYGYMAESVRRKGQVDLVYSIERREWKGDTHLQLRVKDIHV
ncbi:MAG: single-stranded-DNA-specific exonuclease RecJ [Chloroflexota bacterium]|nr:single-stranded-DNA-specific exonuclease RecJ [Chloroflexota bacterium]